MKISGKWCAVLVGGVLLTAGGFQALQSHCEMPCGIYGDQTRIDLLYEDIATVEKSMQVIDELVQGDPPNVNQVVRWVDNKETHASKIQHIVSQYFMTQRVKPKATADAAYDKYIQQLKTLHSLLIHAMKAKQTTDQMHCKHMRVLVDQFAEAYFSAEDLKAIRERHGKPASE